MCAPQNFKKSNYAKEKMWYLFVISFHAGPFLEETVVAFLGGNLQPPMIMLHCKLAVSLPNGSGSQWTTQIVDTVLGSVLFKPVSLRGKTILRPS